MPTIVDAEQQLTWQLESTVVSEEAIPAVLPDLGTSVSRNTMSGGPDLLISTVSPDGTTVYFAVEFKSDREARSLPAPQPHPRMPLQEFDEMLYRKGIIAGLPTPRPVTVEDEARLRDVPPTFRRRKSIAEKYADVIEAIYA